MLSNSNKSNTWFSPTDRICDQNSKQITIKAVGTVPHPFHSLVLTNWIKLFVYIDLFKSKVGESNGSSTTLTNSRINPQMLDEWINKSFTQLICSQHTFKNIISDIMTLNSLIKWYCMSSIFIREHNKERYSYSKCGTFT